MKLYRDDKGKLKRTRSGHYRFDLVTINEDGTPHSSVLGFRLDYDRQRILPITVPRGTTVYTVAEIAPESHRELTLKLCDIITREIEEDRIKSLN